MSDNFKNLLPDPSKQAESKLNPETVLNNLATTINDRYFGRIIASVTSAGEVIEKDHIVLNYSLYLIFTRHQDYSYPLLTATCKNRDGSYPINVLSHYSPPKDYGEVTSEEQFVKVLEEILKEERTRNVILSMY
jgi:hypothetical protein